MTITKYPSLPNPTKLNDPNWNEFSNYLKANSINEQNGPAIDAYQNAASGKFVSAETLNHCLTLIKYGCTSCYADLTRGQFGELDDWDYQHSLKELDEVFKLNACTFENSSIVYKGIGSAIYYQILNLSELKQEETIVFPGFLSTSVCREKAVSFARGKNRILLEISGLEKAQAIIPINKKVLCSPTSDIPEQEVLFNRGLNFVVIDNQLYSDGIRVVRMLHLIV